MKLSFSTNGWQLGFDQLINVCAENKIGGLEIHDINCNAFKSTAPFSKENIRATVKKLFENGVCVSCIDAVGNFARIDDNAKNFEEVKRLIGLA